MKVPDNYKRVIAHKEQSAGNETIGDMWVDTATFSPETPISEIVEWAKNCSGKLFITVDLTDSSESDLNF